MNYLEFSAAGFRNGTILKEVGTTGGYWSADESNSVSSYLLGFDERRAMMLSVDRPIYRSVRCIRN